jgi:transposase-like protein
VRKRFDILVQPRRDAKAAKRFFRKLLICARLTPRARVTTFSKVAGVE